MPRFILSLGLCFVVIAPSSAIAQMSPGNPHVPGAVGCDDSPMPGKRPPNRDCAVLVHKNFDTLPPGPLVWRFENFPTTDAAQRASTPASAVVEAGGKVWLLTLPAKGVRSKGATFVAETELLPPIPSGPSYEIVVSEANLGQEANVMTHKHSGPETWFLLTGEQCLELPDGVVRARAGETMSAPAETPMKLNIIGPAQRERDNESYRRQKRHTDSELHTNELRRLRLRAIKEELLRLSGPSKRNRDPQRETETVQNKFWEEWGRKQ